MATLALNRVLAGLGHNDGARNPIRRMKNGRASCKYANAAGPYSTRLKVETIGGFFAYYDELFFRFRAVDIQ